MRTFNMLMGIVVTVCLACALFIVGLTAVMIQHRHNPIIRTRRVWFITAQTVVSFIWIVLVTVRTLGGFDGICNATLDALQSLLQCSWLALWIVRSFRLVRILRSQLPEPSYLDNPRILGGLLILVTLPSVIFFMIDVTATTPRCTVTPLFILHLVIITNLHLFSVLVGIHATMALPVPYKTGPKALIAVLVLSNLLLIVGLSAFFNPQHGSIFRAIYPICISVSLSIFHAFQGLPLLFPGRTCYDPIIVRVGDTLRHEEHLSVMGDGDGVHSDPDERGGGGGAESASSESVCSVRSVLTMAQSATVGGVSSAPRTSQNGPGNGGGGGAASGSLWNTVDFVLRQQDRGFDAGEDAMSLMSVSDPQQLQAVIGTSTLERAKPNSSASSFLDFAATIGFKRTVGLMREIDAIMRCPKCDESTQLPSKKCSHRSDVEDHIISLRRKYIQPYLGGPRVGAIRLTNPHCLQSEISEDHLPDVLGVIKESTRVRVWFRELERELVRIALPKYTAEALKRSDVVRHAEVVAADNAFMKRYFN